MIYGDPIIGEGATGLGGIADVIAPCESFRARDTVGGGGGGISVFRRLREWRCCFDDSSMLRGFGTGFGSELDFSLSTAHELDWPPLGISSLDPRTWLSALSVFPVDQPAPQPEEEALLDEFSCGLDESPQPAQVSELLELLQPPFHESDSLLELPKSAQVDADASAGVPPQASVAQAVDDEVLVGERARFACANGRPRRLAEDQTGLSG